MRHGAPGTGRSQCDGTRLSLKAPEPAIQRYTHSTTLATDGSDRKAARLDDGRIVGALRHRNPRLRMGTRTHGSNDAMGMTSVRQLDAYAFRLKHNAPLCAPLLVAIALLTLLISPVARVRADVYSADVERAIERGREALLNTIRTNDEITWTLGSTARLRTESGRVIRQRGGTVQLEQRNGDVIDIPRANIRLWKKRGFVDAEMESTHHGGPTVLAAFALLSADVELSDERMSMMIQALSDHGLPEAGTYVRSLRAGVWAKLLNAPRITSEQRIRFKRFLYKDVQWLRAEMKTDGAFDYGHDISVNPNSGDASNTQFGNLGLWLGDMNGGEVGRDAWLKVERYWMKGQDPGGGWSYIAGAGRSTSSMTVAGCNSLYIVLERLYARGDRPYRRYAGCKPNRIIRKRVAQIFQAIQDGNSYLKLHPPDVAQHHRYELFGIERLGLASGRAEIGGEDWFRTHAPAAVSHRWGHHIVADAFTLIFLVHGQAPVLIQKLQHGEDEDSWNYYFRDLHGLSIYLSNSFERLYRWQYVPRNADLRTLENSRILFISGRDSLEFNETMKGRLRTYVDNGGLIILHADLGSRKFSRSVRPLFESMFAREGWTFNALPEHHDLYTCLHGKESRRKRIPLEAITDGPRILVLLSPVDLAGAWHQQRENFKDIFEIMGNIRVYTAPAHDVLPRVLRRDETPTAARARRGQLRIKRFRHGGDWDAHLDMWRRRHARLSGATGIDIVADETGDRSEDLSEFDIVHFTTRGRVKPTKEEVAILKSYVNGGGLLLVESADGTPNGNRAIVKMMRLIDVGDQRVLARSDALMTGAFPEGKPLSKLVTTPAGASLIPIGDAPPIFLRVVDDRIGMIACPFDLSAGLERHHIWNRVGFDSASTDQIVHNILNFRLAQIQGAIDETSR